MLTNPLINSTVQIWIPVILEEDQAIGICLLVLKNQVTWSNSFELRSWADEQTQMHYPHAPLWEVG